MPEHFNGLTPAEAERLAFLAEEAAEVAQAAMKVLRHGYESDDPTSANGPNNREALQQEIGHVIAAFRLMIQAEDIRYTPLEAEAERKRVSVRRWMHHQG